MFRWLRRNKTDIILGVQFGLFRHFTTVGIWSTYLLIGNILGVPIGWLSIIITMVMAMASTVGLTVWFHRTKV